MFLAIPQMSSFATLVLSIIIMCVRCSGIEITGKQFPCHLRSSELRIHRTCLCFLCMWLQIHRSQTFENSSLHLPLIDEHGNKRIRVIEGGWFTSPRAMQCRRVCPPSSRSANLRPPYHAPIMSAALLQPQSPECERASTRWWSDLPRVTADRALGFGSLAMADMSMKSLGGQVQGLKWLLFLTSPLLLGFETHD